MKKLRLIIACSCLLTCFWSFPARSQPTSAFAASHLKAAEAALIASGINNNLEGVYQNIIQTSSKNVPEENREKYIEIMSRFMNKYMGWDALKNDLSRIYAEEFTESELKELTKFYGSPLGKKFAVKMPDLQKKGMELGQKRVQQHQEELKQEFEKAIPKE